MDELTDMWREQKNMNDFALDFIDTWQDEVNRLVRKDYNHACVVLYSTGNEVAETAQPKGIALLTAHSKESVASTRARLYQKFFGQKGSSKDWDDFVLSL